MLRIPAGPSRALRALDRLVAIGENVTLAALLGWIVVVLTAQVAFRYFLASPLTWTEEMARLALVWMTFIGGAVAAREKSHLVVDVISRRYSGVLALLYTAVVALITVGFSLLLVRYGVELGAMQAIATSPALQVPMTLFSAPVVVWAVLTLFHLVIAVLLGAPQLPVADAEAVHNAPATTAMTAAG